MFLESSPPLDLHVPSFRHEFQLKTNHKYKIKNFQIRSSFRGSRAVFQAKTSSAIFQAIISNNISRQYQNSITISKQLWNYLEGRWTNLMTEQSFVTMNGLVWSIAVVKISLNLLVFRNGFQKWYRASQLRVFWPTLLCFLYKYRGKWQRRVLLVY